MKKQHHCSFCHNPIHMVDRKWIHDTEPSWCRPWKDGEAIKAAPPEAYKCDYCGRTFPHVVAVHSGSRECGRCWDWRKLRSAEAGYWNDQINGLFDDGKGSRGPDMNDLMLWKQWGVQDEVVEALNVLEALRTRYELMLEAPDVATRESIIYDRESEANV